MGAPPTVSDNVSSFVNHLMSGSLAMGDRDICDMNGDRSPENVQGSAVNYVNHSIVDDNQKYEFGQLMGVPTSKLPDDSVISSHQQKPTGKQYYSRGLDQPAGKEAPSICRDRAWTLKRAAMGITLQDIDNTLLTV